MSAQLNETQNLNMWLGRDGRYTPESLVKPYEKLKEQTIVPLFEQWIELHEAIANLKANTIEDVDKLIELCADSYGVKLDGNKGGVSLYKYDGAYLLQRTFKNRTVYDERILAAEQLIREYLATKTDDSDPELKGIIDVMLQRNKQGDLRIAELIRLRTLKIDDPVWNQAMDIISDALNNFQTCCYFQVYKRNSQGKYDPLLLDFAAVQPKKKAEKADVSKYIQVESKQRYEDVDNVVVGNLVVIHYNHIPTSIEIPTLADKRIAAEAWARKAFPHHVRMLSQPCLVLKMLTLK